METDFNDIAKELDEKIIFSEAEEDARVKGYLRKTTNAYNALLFCFRFFIINKKPIIYTADLMNALHFDILQAERCLNRLTSLGVLKKEKFNIFNSYTLAKDENGKEKLLKYVRYADDLRQRDMVTPEKKEDAQPVE